MNSILDLFLETERLIIRPIKKEDLDSVFEYCSDPLVCENVTWNAHQTKEDTQSFFEYAFKNYQENNPEPLGICLKENPNKVIGTCGFAITSRKNKSAEMMYVIGRNYWGKGYMTEAAKEVLKVAFEKFNMVRVVARCLTFNAASEKVMQKMGMTYEGTQRKSMNIKGQFWDLKVYSMIDEEWEKIKNGI